MRRVNAHLADSTSRISFEALHATNIDRPSYDGCAHVGEQVSAGTFGASSPCAATSWPNAACDRGGGGPAAPFSAPFVTKKWRDTLSVLVSISTSTSSIMQTE